MFGLTRREQRWKAEQKAAETIAGVLVAAINAKSRMGEEMNKADEYEILERAHVAAGAHMMQKSPRADELIACLEGEIAKRDETIARLEPQLNRAIQANYDLRAELAAIKAQGVVMPPSPYMPGSQPTDFTDYELGEIHGRIAMWEEVKRLNAAPVQQVSVPDGKVCVPVEVLRLYEFMAASFTPFTSQHEQIAISLRKAKAAMLAAPAAPAADAGGVLEQAMYTLIIIGYHENSGLVHELRQAIAAHRAKGVV